MNRLEDSGLVARDGRRVGLAGHERYHFMGSPDAGIVKHEVFAAPVRPMLDLA